MQLTETEEFETTHIDGRLCWVFPDGRVHPVIRGGAVDDDDADEDGDDGGDDDEDEDPDDDQDDDDGDEDDPDADTEELVEHLVEQITDRLREELAEELGLVTESELDRRINKLVRKLRRGDDAGSSSRKGSRRRDEDDDDRDEFSVRTARLAGMEIVRDELGRMTSDERTVARGLLDSEIAKQRDRGEDDEDAAGEKAATAVVRQVKALRDQSRRRAGRTAKRGGQGPSTQRRRQSAGSARTTKSKLSKGAERAAARFGTGSTNEGK